MEALRRNRSTQVEADGERHYQWLRWRRSIGVEADGERHYQGCLVLTTLLWVIETKFPPSHDHLALIDLCKEGAHCYFLHFLSLFLKYLRKLLSTTIYTYSHRADPKEIEY